MKNKSRKRSLSQKCDIFNVLAHVAYAEAPLTREERAARAHISITRQCNSTQQAFLDFVLGHYVNIDEEGLDEVKLTPLLRLRYGNSLKDAMAEKINKNIYWISEIFVSGNSIHGAA